MNYRGKSREYLTEVYLVVESLIVSDKVCKFMTNPASQCLVVVVVDSRWWGWKYEERSITTHHT